MALTGSQAPNEAVSRLPRFHHTDGEDVAFLASSYGLTPDPWQRLVVDHFFGRNSKDELTVSQCCVSVPRQNGKGGTIEMVELYQAVVQGKKVLHTAHQIKTARAAFIRLRSYFEDDRYPELKAMVSAIRQSNGQEAIELTNGGAVMFSARSQGAARGLTVDTLVMDEAQDLGDETLAALLPTISAAPSGEPQQLILGTPPTTKSDGEVWKRLRESAQAGGNRRMMWAEWSPSSEGPIDLHDEAIWAEANPALGLRLQTGVIQDELSSMEPSVFMRERLGMWVMGGGEQSVLPEADWKECADKTIRLTEDQVAEITLAVDLSPNRDSGSIVAAIAMADGSDPIIDVIDQRGGSPDWIVPRVAQIVAERDVSAVIIDSYGPAASLITALEDRGIGVTKAKISFVAESAERLIDMVMIHQVRHFDQSAMNVAIAGARRRKVGDGRIAFGRLHSATDISPLVAGSMALNALYSHDENLEHIKYRRKRRKRQPGNYQGTVQVL